MSFEYQQYPISLKLYRKQRTQENSTKKYPFCENSTPFRAQECEKQEAFSPSVFYLPEIQMGKHRR